MTKATEKSPARRAADARYEAGRIAVLVRFTPNEVEAIDAARGNRSRPAYLRARALADWVRAAKKGRGQ